MRCERFRELYDMLDSGEEPNFFLQLHISACPACRAEVERMEAAIAEYRIADSRAAEASAPAAGGLSEASPSYDALMEGVEDRVMASIRLMKKPRRELHARDWIVSGCVILGSMALIPYDHNFDLIKEAFGASYALPLSLVLGIAFTLYAAVFIATHMEELAPFAKRMGRRA